MVIKMTLTEIKELKIGDYGEICMRNKLGFNITCTGTIVFVSKKGTVTFYENDRTEYHKKPDDIVYFTPKEMLPPPTEYRGKKVVFDGTGWHSEDGKEVTWKEFNR
jgi:hypothetical protein